MGDNRTSMALTAKAKAKVKSKTKASLKPSPKELPKMFQGAAVVRGQGMNADKLETFIERKALDQFFAVKDMWLVIQDKAFEDIDECVEVKAFDNKDDAVLFAQARANGNIDHRVLRVTDQVLVIATMNAL